MPLQGVKMLKVMPSFPYPETGAEQIDRANGIRQAVRLGCEVSVIAKAVAWADKPELEAKAHEWGVKRLTLVPYKYSNKELTTPEHIKKFFGKFRNPLYLDGAAYEYTDPLIKKALREELAYEPDLVWFDYTYLWPLYGVVRKAGIPILTQSNNFEPVHFLDEDGRTFLHYLKFVPKFCGEFYSTRSSNFVFAVTPQETSLYRRLGCRKVETLPTRGLPRFLAIPRPQIRDRAPLHVFFMGSSYNVEHNKAAAALVIRSIAPAIRKQRPGRFVFHIFGAKLPEDLRRSCDNLSVIYEGYRKRDELDSMLNEMDIALVPSLMGAGMQQKVFEPMARGFPTITSSRAIAGYALRAGEEYVPARSTEEFVSALIALEDKGLRQKLSDAASAKTAALFSQHVLDTIVVQGVREAIS